MIKIFQNSCLITKGFKKKLDFLLKDVDNFEDAIEVYKGSLYGANHVLLEKKSNQYDLFYTNFSYQQFSDLWINKYKTKQRSSREVLLSQLEEFKPDVIYDQNPSEDFSRAIKHFSRKKIVTVLWQGAPNSVDQDSYNYIVSNFPGLLDAYKSNNASKWVYHTPSFSEKIAELLHGSAINKDIDVLIFGSISRMHLDRAKKLFAILSELKDEYTLHFHCEETKFMNLAGIPLINKLPIFGGINIPEYFYKINKMGIYGDDLYSKIARSKLVINTHAFNPTGILGNLRCFEVLNCESILLTENARYPSGFINNNNFIEYDSVEDLISKVRLILNEYDGYKKIAQAGYKMLNDEYGKEIVLSRLISKIL